MSESETWQKHIERDLGEIGNLLEPLNFKLDEIQPHISGERFLMTKQKLVLAASNVLTQKKVIIKASKVLGGQDEISRERKIRAVLNKLAFASEVLLMADEIYFGELGDYLFWISEFIEQESAFPTLSTETQFFIAMNAFEAQEGFYASTFENLEAASQIFPIYNARTYLESFSKFLGPITTETRNLLQQNAGLIDKYCGYLTHTDFAPANARIKNGDLYLIDLSSMLFGNKYEGWARFLNWALVHSPELEKVLVEYVEKNRGQKEAFCLRLMRIYKVGFLINYYENTLEKTSGDLKKLNKIRIDFWSRVSGSLTKNIPIDERFIEEYRSDRNGLRSEEEAERQKEFNIPNL